MYCMRRVFLLFLSNLQFFVGKFVNYTCAFDASSFLALFF